LPFGANEFHHNQQQRHIPDLDLITAWEQQEQLRLEQDRVNGQFQQFQSTVSGVVSVPTQEFSTLEYENFKAPASSGTLNNNNDSAWAQEWSRQQGNVTDDEDEDEFREEWSNENFTQTYINNHQLKFQEIEEQDRLKEARLEEERERQRQASGGPPRNAWMMAGTISTNTETSGTSAFGSKRLKVPGLDSFDPPSEQQSSAFCVSEFMNFDYHGNTQPQSVHSNPNPIRSDDRFLPFVSDLHTAEQIYYPGATSATNPEQLDVDHNTPTTSSAWAQEFATEDQQRKQMKKFLGAEWNWEKLFGKDPRKQTSPMLATNESESDNIGKIVDENDRLRTVALARLQALFGHLSLASPQESMINTKE
ncbi:hypothetical protein BGZ76_001752, partial [Entomortierella beljakovae]